jgi:two-component system alkaline phosphatase synthesis response regulator PhoP
VNKPKPRILLVEDDVGLGEAYQARLEAEGFEVMHCSDGEKALQSAVDFLPDLILLDIMMPNISGLDVLDILRNTPKLNKVKVIVLTALGLPSDQKRAKDLGADDYMIKSQAVVADVVKRIRYHLGLNKASSTN